MHVYSACTVNHIIERERERVLAQLITEMHTFFLRQSFLTSEPPVDWSQPRHQGGVVQMDNAVALLIVGVLYRYVV